MFRYSGGSFSGNKEGVYVCFASRERERWIGMMAAGFREKEEKGEHLPILGFVFGLYKISSSVS